MSVVVRLFSERRLRSLRRIPQIEEFRFEIREGSKCGRATFSKMISISRFVGVESADASEAVHAVVIHTVWWESETLEVGCLVDIVPPRPAAHDAEGTGVRSAGIDLRVGGVWVHAVPCPFPSVTGHVVKAVGIGHIRSAAGLGTIEKSGTLQVGKFVRGRDAD